MAGNPELEAAHEVKDNESSLIPIWGAMLVAVLLYAGLAYYDVGGDSVNLDQEVRNWVLIFLAMSAGLHVLTALLLRQMIASLSKGNYVTYCVIRWVLMEGIAIYGLVLSFLNVDFGIVSIFFAASILLIGASRPGASDRAVFVSQFS